MSDGKTITVLPALLVVLFPFPNRQEYKITNKATNRRARRSRKKE